MINRWFSYAGIWLLFLSADLHSQLPESDFRSDSVVQIEPAFVRILPFQGPWKIAHGSVSFIDPELLQSGDFMHMQSALNTIPGVFMQSGTNTTNRLTIRGMGSRTPYNTNRIRAYLNDIPLTASDGISSPEEIDPEGLGRIELLKGPSSALFGSGLGGSLNLYTPTAEKKTGSIRLQAGSHQTARFGAQVAGIRNAHWGWASLELVSTEGYRQNNEYFRTSWLSSGGISRENTDIQITIWLSGVRAGIPSSLGKSMYESNPSLAAPNWLAVNGYKEYFKALGGVSVRKKFAPSVVNRLIVYGRFTDSYEKRPFNNLNDDAAAMGLRNRLTLYVKNMQWIIGGDMSAEQYAWKLDLNDSLVNRNREVRYLVQGYVMGWFQPFGGFSLSVGSSVNSSSYWLFDGYGANGDQSGQRRFPVVFSPRLAISYEILPNLSVFSAAGHGFSLPSPEETLLPEGSVNESIRPETGWQVDAGIRMRLDRIHSQAEIVGYLIELQNLLVTKRVTEDQFTGINAGRTRHTGIELRWNGDLFSESLFPGRLSYAATYHTSVNRFIRFVDDGNSYNSNLLPGIPAQSGSMWFRWELTEKWRLEVIMTRTGRQYLNDANTASYGSYSLMNLKANWKINLHREQGLLVYAGVNNLFDEKYASMIVPNASATAPAEPRYYYPGSPRNLYAGIKWMW